MSTACSTVVAGEAVDGAGFTSQNVKQVSTPTGFALHIAVLSEDIYKTPWCDWMIVRRDCVRVARGAV